MVDVICDTSFLIHLATRKISNTEEKRQDATATLEFAQNLKTIEMSGKFADQAIIEHVRNHGGMIATMDKELKNKIKSLNGSIISFSNDKIVLES